ncbi:MAG: flagellin [Lachnospiraceae bacterium]|nr:flagellin [Lachnospiraceae bacterium]
MKINHNLSAVVANNKLHQNEDVVANSMERLASGIRINHAKDDPAGMAISNRMTTQIDGVDRASQNSSDAAAMIETADGALGEVTEIIQRMRELSVQAANDTNALSDREAIRKEIAELKKEIDRMSRDTEFNTKGLLDGTLDNRFYPTKSINDPGTGCYVADMTRISVSDYVTAGDYTMKIKTATQTVLEGSGTFGIDPTSTTKIGEANAGTINVNGFVIEINADDTEASAYLKICDGMEKAEVQFDVDSTNKTTLRSQFYGSQHTISVVTSNPNLAALIGQIETDPSDPNHGNVTAGNDATVIPDSTSAFGDKNTSYTADGNHITIHQPGGFEIDFLANAQLSSTAESEITLHVTTMGAMQVQIGANENQTTHIRIPRLDLETLYLDDLDVTTVNGADRAIGKLDYALNKVSSVRAKIGAYENRLDHAVASLDQSSENLTKAFSDLADVDMAEEMTKYTQYNVLVQASTSVLAQANDLPESVLQLLQ